MRGSGSGGPRTRRVTRSAAACAETAGNALEFALETFPDEARVPLPLVPGASPRAVGVRCVVFGSRCGAGGAGGAAPRVKT